MAQRQTCPNCVSFVLSSVFFNLLLKSGIFHVKILISSEAAVHSSDGERILHFATVLNTLPTRGHRSSFMLPLFFLLVHFSFILENFSSQERPRVVQFSAQSRLIPRQRPDPDAADAVPTASQSLSFHRCGEQTYGHQRGKAGAEGWGAEMVG